MKRQIEETLRCLIGHSFWGAGRAADLLTFQFGPRQLRTNCYGKTHEVGMYALHVQCAWHIVDARHVIAASGDRCYESSEISEEMRHDEGDLSTRPEAEVSLLDEQLFDFFQQCEKSPLFVQTVCANELGALTIGMNYNITLSIFPDHSADFEYWRFFQPGKDLPHFVVTGQGIEDQEE